MLDITDDRVIVGLFNHQVSTQRQWLLGTINHFCSITYYKRCGPKYRNDIQLLRQNHKYFYSINDVYTYTKVFP